MTEKLKQTIEEEIAQLPQEIQEAISAFDWVKVASEIGNKNNLTEEEIEDFQLETLLVLVGAVDPEFYAINIENHVETTKDMSVSIASEAFQKIFSPINKTIEENIKKNLKNKNPKYDQTVDFILSGGDYSAFISQNSPLPEYPSGGGGQVIPPRLSATPQEGNNTQETVLPAFSIKKENLKDQFKI